jgi:hypothetical protein
LRRPSFRLWDNRDSSAPADIEGQSHRNNNRASSLGRNRTRSTDRSIRSRNTAKPMRHPPKRQPQGRYPLRQQRHPSHRATHHASRHGRRAKCCRRMRKLVSQGRSPTLSKPPSRSCPFEGIDHDRSPYSCGGAACRSQPIRQSVCSFASITSQSQQLETARSFRGSTLATAATLMRRPVTRLSNRRSTPHSDWRSGMSKRMPTAVIERIALGDAAMPFRSS